MNKNILIWIIVLIALSSFASAQVSFYGDIDNLYKFDNCALTDTAGTYNLTTKAGSPTATTDPFGNANAACKSNAGHYFQTATFMGNAEESLTGWIKQTTTTGSGSFGKSHSPAAWATFGWQEQNGDISAKVGGGSGGSFNTNLTINNQWQCITINMYASSFDIYVNGSQVSKGTFSGARDLDNQPLSLGGTAYATAPDITMVNMIFMDRALTPSEIIEFCDAGELWDVVNPLKVNITSPANNTITSTATQTFVYNASATTGSLDNCSLFYDGSKVLTNSTGTINTTNNFTYTIDPGTKEWYINCSLIDGNVTISDIYNITYSLNTSETYDPIAFNTLPTTLSATIYFPTVDASLFSGTNTVLLDFNGTNYTVSLASSTANSLTYSKEFTLDLNPVERHINHTWYFNISSLSNDYLNTSPKEQTFTDQSANITFNFYDEINNSLLTGTSITLDFIGSTYSYNYTTATGQKNVSLFFPLTYIARYTASGYSDRFHYFTLSNDTTQTIDLYLLKDANATEVIATVYNEIGIKLEGVRIKVLKYDVLTNTFKQVESSDTNFEGETVLHLVLNEEYYKFILEYPTGTTRDITTPTYIFNSAVTFQIDTGLDIGGDFYLFDDVSANVTYNPNTFNFRLNYYDHSGLSSQMCLEITKNGAYYNRSCLSAISGTILLPITNTSGTYKGSVYLVYDGDDIFLTSATIRIGEKLQDQSLGLYLMVFVTILFIFIGFWNLSISLFIAPLPLLIGSFLQITGISFGVMLSIQVLFIILAFVVSRRS